MTTGSENAGGAAQTLADELRGVAAALSVCDVAERDLRAAVSLARELRRRLDGPPRARWYDGDANLARLDAESRRAYVEQSPVRGRLNPVAPPLEIEIGERSDGSRGVFGRARFSMAYEGLPRGVHGGLVAALFDEVLGVAQGLSGRPGVTARLGVTYRAVTPVERELRFEGWIHQESGRRVVARATCHAGDTLTAEAEGLFARVDFNEIQRRAQGR